MHGSLAKVTELAPKAKVHEVEGSSGRTALHKAAFWGHDHLMDILIRQCKIDPNVQDYNGDTALHDAARFGHVKVRCLCV
jgi:cytochrome c peroxidase